MRRTRRAGLAALTFGVFVGCFSTIEPDRKEPEQPPSYDPDAATVRGLTLQWWGPGDVRRRPGWSVRAEWYRGEVAPDSLLFKQIVSSNSSGVYTFSTTDKRVTDVVIRALVCTFGEDDPNRECCIFARVCDCPADPWGSATALSIRPGIHHEQFDVAVKCGR